MAPAGGTRIGMMPSRHSEETLSGPERQALIEDFSAAIATDAPTIAGRRAFQIAR